MFLFDPTQDMRFRRLCEGKTSDPQMMVRSERFAQEKPVRQETILSEAALRVRRYAGIGQNQRFARPLVMVISKYDSWAELLPFKELPPPYLINKRTDLYALRLGMIEEISQAVGELLWGVSPEIVSAAESFSNQVIYIPCSATGCIPEIDSKNGGFGFRPQNLKPIWSEIPLLYVMSKWMGSLVPFVQNEKSGGGNHRTHREPRLPGPIPCKPTIAGRILREPRIDIHVRARGLKPGSRGFCTWLARRA